MRQPTKIQPTKILYKLAAFLLTIPLLLSDSTTFLFAAEDKPLFPTPSTLSPSAPTVLHQATNADGSINAVISLPALQDTYVASNPRSLNFGGADTLLLGYNSQGSNLGALRSLIWFDFPGPIPSGAIINSARIRLYLYGVTGGSMNAQIRHLVSGWNEFVVTWDNHEPDWGSVDTSVGIGTNTGWVEWDITQLTKRWQNGSEANDGVIIIGDENPSEHQRAFWSRNANNGQHPQLIVDYSQAAPDREPPRTRFEHPTNRYQQSDRFSVEWHADDPGNSGVDYYDIQYRETGQDWRDWLSHTSQTESSFLGQEGKTYEFRGRAVDKAHNVEAFPGSPQATTTVDTLPPTVTMQPLSPFTGNSTVQLNWSASDAASGVRAYDLQFRLASQAWNDLLLNTTQTSFVHNAANAQQLEFRVRAFDHANHASAWDDPNASTRTTIDTIAPIACIVLVAAETNSGYRIHWAGDDGNGSGVRAYNVRYRFNNGDWQPWQQQVGFDNALFTPPQGDGAYFFTIQAVDNANNQGSYQDNLGSALQVGASTIITGTTMIYMPVIGNQRICKL